MKKDKDIEFYRKLKTEKLSKLHDYYKSYNIDLFMSDLISYFEGEVDFDIDNIRKYLKDSAKLDELISLAKTNSTHPVIEFIQKIFKELARE